MHHVRGEADWGLDVLENTVFYFFRFLCTVCVQHSAHLENNTIYTYSRGGPNIHYMDKSIGTHL